MNTVIHASSSQVITPAMRNTIRNAVGAKLGNIVTPDATVHVNVKKLLCSEDLLQNNTGFRKCEIHAPSKIIKR